MTNHALRLHGRDDHAPLLRAPARQRASFAKVGMARRAASLHCSHGTLLPCSGRLRRLNLGAARASGSWSQRIGERADPTLHSRRMLQPHLGGVVPLSDQAAFSDFFLNHRKMVWTILR
jgi:hypothetical protein